MEIQERYDRIMDWFRKNRPLAKSELDFRNPFELLVAVILSAQCTDRRVNLTTPALFARFPDPASLAAADEETVFDLIRHLSYPHSKAAHLVAAARRLTTEFGGEVPEEIPALLTLPGVGRKTANVVASIIYDRPVIAVDTHVFRVSRRTGLSDGKTPEAVEKDLESHIPEEDRAKAHHWLILHGRYVCTARRPQCAACGLRDWCRDCQSRQA